MSEWVKVHDGTVAEMQPAKIYDIEILLINVDGKISCYLDSCSHENARLSEGEYFDGDLYCPKHGACFDAATGKAKSLPATQTLTAFEAEQRKDGVYVLWNR